MAKTVLDVGQCVPDHSAIRRMLEQNFSVLVDQAHTADAALTRLRKSPCDLVLVNRLFDFDYSEGMDLIRSMKADPALNEIPVMLVTNYPEHQQAALAAGAAPGFGKNALSAPATIKVIRDVLKM